MRIVLAERRPIEIGEAKPIVEEVEYMFEELIARALAEMVRFRVRKVRDFANMAQEHHCES